MLSNVRRSMLNLRLSATKVTLRLYSFRKCSSEYYNIYNIILEVFLASEMHVYLSVMCIYITRVLHCFVVFVSKFLKPRDHYRFDI